MALLDAVGERVVALGAVGFLRALWARLRGKGDTPATTPPAPALPGPRPARWTAPKAPDKYIIVQGEKVLNVAFAFESFRSTPFLLREALVGQFKGLKAGTMGVLHSIDHRAGEYSIHVTGQSTSVFAVVSPEAYPGLGLLSKDDSVAIVGTIDSISEYGVTLAPQPELVFD